MLHVLYHASSVCLVILYVPFFKLEVIRMSYAFYRFSGSGEPCAHLIRLPVPSSCSLWLELLKCRFKVLLLWKAWMEFRNFRSTVMIVQQTVCLLHTHGISHPSASKLRIYECLHLLFQLWLEYDFELLIFLHFHPLKLSKWNIVMWNIIL